mmetsp:Transcript_12436/g.30135  ORF Transcript_12436/g.30135 Transcript_12436/m.30135 type:complete len:218 (-) Transcript_12436:150-803(-)
MSRATRLRRGYLGRREATQRRSALRSCDETYPTPRHLMRLSGSTTSTSATSRLSMSSFVRNASESWKATTAASRWLAGIARASELMNRPLKSLYMWPSTNERCTTCTAGFVPNFSTTGSVHPLIIGRAMSRTHTVTSDVLPPRTSLSFVCLPLSRNPSRSGMDTASLMGISSWSHSNSFPPLSRIWFSSQKRPRVTSACRRSRRAIRASLLNKSLAS